MIEPKLKYCTNFDDCDGSSCCGLCPKAGRHHDCEGNPLTPKDYDDRYGEDFGDEKDEFETIVNEGD